MPAHDEGCEDDPHSPRHALSEDRTRIILNTCWGSESDAKKEQSHETMEAMFG
ncbi:hypothetical protein OIE13_13470 [Streptosporangium sp. NBC_01810]|uniref:HalD/BesD family halogenase n=1 Tax=Streptosporangium sp. NBC_01810 TaxID=2975951 RepID=UPI002DD82BE9|nr:hypothetical protein [Streptosporangium sp. NBC_01810]WSA28791.1 hypothetical protein OIE13_13470 [Streptosporangium sp. NBC_01810]